MKLYLGSRDIKPKGFLSVDIDPAYNSDIVANIVDLSPIPNESCAEVIASHVIEHLEWPDGFKALAEMSRVLKREGILKIAVLDMKAMLELLNNSDNEFYAVGMLFGVGGRNSGFEQHRYGYTAKMLMRILDTLGFGNFDWWGSTLPEGANGWGALHGDRIAISLNIQAEKVGPPTVPVNALYDALCQRPMNSIEIVLADVFSQQIPTDSKLSEVSLYQRIHMQLIDARCRIHFLENMHYGNIGYVNFYIVIGAKC